MAAKELRASIPFPKVPLVLMVPLLVIVAAVPLDLIPLSNVLIVPLLAISAFAPLEKIPKPEPPVELMVPLLVILAPTP